MWLPEEFCLRAVLVSALYGGMRIVGSEARAALKGVGPVDVVERRADVRDRQTPALSAGVGAD